MCARPFTSGVLEYGCGQCKPCRINRRRIWTSRLMLESTLYEQNSFVTLTYSDVCLPDNKSLVPEHLQLFFKRLRKLLDPLKIRYYAVGEYGDVSRRPHYHMILFNYRPEDHIPVAQQARGKVCPCAICKSWGKGHVDIGEVTSASAAYTCSYVLKGDARDCSVRGVVPEFSRMSLRPGIGALAVDGVGDVFTQSSEGARWLAVAGDVPNSAKAAGRTWPLGKYLRRRLSNQVGIDTKLKESARSRLVALESHEVRDARARSRVQHVRNALVRSKIVKSKRGL